MKSVHIVHRQYDIHAVLAVHHLAKSAPILVSHPTIGTNEPEPTTRFETPQADFVETDVDVRPTAHGGAGCPVGGHAFIRDVFKSNIGRVAHDEVDFVSIVFP